MLDSVIVYGRNVELDNVKFDTFLDKKVERGYESIIEFLFLENIR